MINIKGIFNLKYHPKLIMNMAKETIPGAVAANLIVSSIIAFTLYSFLPHSWIHLWLFAHVILFFLRIFISKKLLYYLQKPFAEKKIKLYFIASLILTSSIAILYAILIYYMTLYPIPDLYIFLIITLLLIVAASSISTLGSVIIAFFLFIYFTVIPLIILALLQNKEIFLILTFILVSYLILHTIFGYRQYIILRDSIFLKDTFKSIYDKSSEGLILIKENRFLDCNEAAIKLFGYDTKESFLTAKLSLLMPKNQPDGQRSVFKMLKMVQMGLKEGTASFEWLHHRKDGKAFWTEIVLTKIILNNEELLHGSWRNIEDRKKLEIAKDAANKEIEALNKSLVFRVNEEVEKNREKDKRLLQQSRMAQMGEMISMIAHQWRQPLAAISATSASMELKASLNKLDNGTAQQKAQSISELSQYLSHTIDDFRNFFKPNKEKSKTDYNEIIRSVLTIIENSIRSQNIQIIQELNSHASFNTYTNELRQVVLNLIKNAEDVLIEKKVEDAYIKISTYTENDKNILEVSDNGGGIAEEIIHTIFDPYFSTKTKKDGTGLGLYMGKIIIEEHCNGKLSTSNNSDGAVFKIELSIKEEETNV